MQSVRRVRSQTALASNGPVTQLPRESALRGLLHIDGQESAAAQQLQAMQPSTRVAANTPGSPAALSGACVLPDSQLNMGSRRQQSPAAVPPKQAPAGARPPAAQTPASPAASSQAGHSQDSFLRIGSKDQHTTGVQQVQAKR